MSMFQDSAALGESLISAVNSGDLGEVTDLVNRYELFYCPEWDQGYVLLFTAIKNKHFDVAKVLLQNGAKVNGSRSTKVDTPLHFATLHGQIDLVEMLIHRNAAINVKNCSGETPLNIAVSQGNEDMVRLLLSRMVVQNLCDPFLLAYLREFPDAVKPLNERSHGTHSLQYALIVASYNGNEKMVQSLLTAGADPNAAVDPSSPSTQRLINYAQYSPSPLFLACCRGHTGIVNHLLKHTVQTHCLRPSDKYSSLHLAAEKGRTEIVRLLMLNGADPSMKADNDLTPFHLAARNGHQKAVKLLLSKSAGINLQNNRGATALLLAAENGHLETVRILLKGGALVNMRNVNNESPLYFAVWTKNVSMLNVILTYRPELDVKIYEAVLHVVMKCHGSFQVVNKLCDYGFAPKCEDAKNVQLVSAAVQKGYTKFFESLLNWGVNPDLTYNGSSLLHFAVMNGCTEIMKLLLNSKCDVNTRDRMGLTPICYVMKCQNRRKYPEITRLLLDNGADLRDVPCLLLESVYEGCFESCEILIKNGADVNTLKGSDTPLLTACKSSSTLPQMQYDFNETARGKILKLLLNKGADFQHKNEEGNSALHLAALYGNIEATYILLNFEANLNENSKMLRNKTYVYDTNIDGETPLLCAVKKNYSEIVQLLLEFDADVNAQNSENATGLHEAIKNENDTIVNILLANGADLSLKDCLGRTALHLASLKTLSPSASVRRPSYRDELLGEQHEADKPMALILKRHVIKLKAANLDISDKIVCLVLSKDNDELNYLQQDCVKEVERMKCKTFSSFCTLYDVFKNQQNPACARNETLMETLLSFSYEEFPIYQSLILNRLKKSKMRLELLTSGQKWLDILLKTSNIFVSEKTPVLPFELIENIASLLSNRELRNLSICGEDLKRQVCK